MRGEMEPVVAVIRGDLAAQRRARARFYAAALGLGALGFAGALALMGVREDLWAQPRAALLLQVAIVIVGMVVLPAVGLGLIFPRRAAQVGLVVATAAAALAASVGEEMAAWGGWGIGCAAVVLGFGGLLMALAGLSGAFAQRARARSALWVAGGVSVSSLCLVTWHCGVDSMSHWLIGHVGGAALVAALAGAGGLWLHRRQRASITPGERWGRVRS